MATNEQPTVKVKVDADTEAFEATLAKLEKRAERLGINPLRMEALHQAVHVECRNADRGADEVLATAEKMLTFLKGEHTDHVHTAVDIGNVIVSGKVVGQVVDIHAEQAAQAHLAKHTGL